METLRRPTAQLQTALHIRALEFQPKDQSQVCRPFFWDHSAFLCAGRTAQQVAQRWRHHVSTCSCVICTFNIGYRVGAWSGANTEIILRNNYKLDSMAYCNWFCIIYSGNWNLGIKIKTMLQGGANLGFLVVASWQALMLPIHDSVTDRIRQLDCHSLHVTS